MIAKDMTNENEKKNRLFVFIGEKISIEELAPEKGSDWHSFTAKYKILEHVYGDYQGGAIEFRVEDRYGAPAFSKYKNVLLYVSEGQHGYYHEEYQFNDVYKTSQGRWAGTYAESDYSHRYNTKTKVKPEKIQFAEEVSYPIEIKGSDSLTKTSFPEPYFRSIEDRAVAVYGNYIEDLFTLKKEGIFTANELFGDKAAKEKEFPIEVELEELTNDRYDSAFFNFWPPVAKSMLESGHQKLKKYSLDSVFACGSVMSSTKFFRKCYGDLFDKNILEELNDTSSAWYGRRQPDSAQLPALISGKIIKEQGLYHIYHMNVQIASESEPSLTLSINFIPTKNGYRFIGCNYRGRKNCCE